MSEPTLTVEQIDLLLKCNYTQFINRIGVYRFSLEGEYKLQKQREEENYGDLSQRFLCGFQKLNKK
jgi:hypothetical protein